jgi:hypothetical protein
MLLKFLQDVLCTVNTQHHCERNGCLSSGFRYIYQERVQTEHQTSVVEHRRNPQDLMLNTAQMRDAVHLQKFRVPSTTINRESLLQESVAQAINQRRTIVENLENESGGAGGSSSSRGRVRGRGRGRLGSTSQGGRRQNQSLAPGEQIVNFS